MVVCQGSVGRCFGSGAVAIAGGVVQGSVRRGFDSVTVDSCRRSRGGD